jgi:TolA-binding protein
MKIFSLLFFIFNILLFAEEVSVFGAGDLESTDPYGLTSSEKVILKNKNNLTKFDRKIDDTRSNIDLLNERIDGLESIFQGDSVKLNSNIMTLSNLKIEQESTQLYIEEISKIQKEENQKRIEQLKFLKNDFNKLNKTFKTLVKEVDKNYVTKKQFDELVTFINNQFKKNKQVKKSKKIKDKKIFIKPNDVLLLDAKALFKKYYFAKAIPIFKHLVKSKYKPAESNFYLGEILFQRKKYKDAIQYFKKSMTLYDKAKYIPRLLLHSAISFEKLNDLDNATNFYGTLIDVYSQSKEAIEAQKNLEKIK